MQAQNAIAARVQPYLAKRPFSDDVTNLLMDAILKACRPAVESGDDD